MASPQAEAIAAKYRARRASPDTTRPTLAEQRAQAEHAGDATAPPTDVEFALVDAGGVPAQWVRPKGAASDRILIYFHAGGYGYCSMRSHSKLIGHIAKAAGCCALNVDYRLAPEHPHPAAINDAIAAYRWLLAGDIDPRCIASVGDSAGGGLGLALLVKARDEGIPLPGAAALMSPWVDLAMTGESIASRADTDLVTDLRSNQHCAEQFLAGTDPRDVYASPLYAELSGLPPLYIQVGDVETLLDDSIRLADKATESGVDVRLDIFPEMQHQFQLFAGNMPEADDAIARIGDFLQTWL